MKTRESITRLKKILVISMISVIAIMYCGCGSSASYDSSGSYISNSPSAGGFATDEKEEAGYIADEDYDVDYAEPSGTSDSNGSSSIYQNKEVKLIRRAELYLETTDFEGARESLEKQVEELGGYMESSEFYGGNYYNGYENHNVTYVARIPSNKYNAFFSILEKNEGVNITRKTESTEDVGLQYADIESHLEMLNTKLDRLKALLKDAELMSDIIEIESAISQTEYEISYYSSDRNRYDDLINYSTITVTIEEVSVYSPTSTSFGERLSSAFSQGIEDFGYAVTDFIIFFVGNILGIIFWIVVIVVIILIIKKLRSRSRLNPEPKKERKLSLKRKEKKTETVEKSDNDYKELDE